MALVFKNAEKLSDVYYFYNLINSSNSNYKTNTQKLFDDLLLEPYEDYIAEDYFVFHAGKILKFPTILDIIYYKPLHRNYTRGTLKEIKYTGQLSTIVDLSMLELKKIDDISKLMKEEKWVSLFNKNSNPEYDPLKSKKGTFFKNNSKLALITFKPKVKFYEEVNYDKENDKKELKPDQAVFVKLKGTNVVTINTSKLEINKIYTITQDNSIKEVNKLTDFEEYKTVPAKDITELLKLAISKT